MLRSGKHNTFRYVHIKQRYENQHSQFQKYVQQEDGSEGRRNKEEIKKSL